MLKATTWNAWGENTARAQLENVIEEKTAQQELPVQGGGDGMATPALPEGLGPLTSSSGCIQGIQAKTVKQSSANHPEPAPEYQA